MAAGSESGARFSVRDSAGLVAHSAPVGAKLGAWGTFTVYALDFTVSKAGPHAIRVTGRSGFDQVARQPPETGSPGTGP